MGPSVTIFCRSSQSESRIVSDTCHTAVGTRPKMLCACLPVPSSDAMDFFLGHAESGRLMCLLNSAPGPSVPPGTPWPAVPSRGGGRALCCIRQQEAQGEVSRASLERFCVQDLADHTSRKKTEN